MSYGRPGRSREHTLRLVAIYLLGLALGLVLLGIWQQGRRAQQPGPAAPAPAEAPPSTPAPTP